MKSAPSNSRTDAAVTGACVTGPARCRGGFTLVEILAALLMMAIIIPVAMEGMSIATRAGMLGQRKAAAMRVAERVLNELIVEGETNRSSATGTTVDGTMTYPWTMRAEPWSEDRMQQVSVTVTFTVQGNEYTVEATTLIRTAADELAAEEAAL